MTQLEEQVEQGVEAVLRTFLLGLHPFLSFFSVHCKPGIPYNLLDVLLHTEHIWQACLETSRKMMMDVLPHIEHI